MQPHTFNDSLLIAPVHIDLITAAGIAALACLLSALWIRQVFIHHRRTAFIFVGVAAFVTATAYLADQVGGFRHLDDFPPKFAFLAVPTLLFFIGIGFSRLGQQLSKSMSYSTLIALQIFRLPLELFMLRAALLDIMPIEFSMLGYNFDVLTGLTALLLLGYRALIGELSLRVIKIWNLFGIACLLIIAGLAVATSPQVHAFGPEREHLNIWVLFFPYSLLPLLLVSYAVLGHIVMSRKLYAVTLTPSGKPLSLSLSKQ
jgi:hypothetical protein